MGKETVAYALLLLYVRSVAANNANVQVKLSPSTSFWGDSALSETDEKDKGEIVATSKS